MNNLNLFNAPRTGQRFPLGKLPLPQPGLAGRPRKVLPPPSLKVQRLIQALSAGVGKAPGFTPQMFATVKAHLLDQGEAAIEQARERFARILQRQSSHYPLGARIIEVLRDPARARRFAGEVLRPAKTRQLTSAESWERTNSITGFDVLRTADSKAPGWTIGIGGGLDVGLGVGAEQTFGLGGMRHRQAFGFLDVAVGAGAYAQLGGGFKVIFAPGPPTEFSGFALGIDAGGAYYAGLAVGGAIIPRSIGRFFLPGLFGDFTQDDLDSITLGVPVGIGVELSATFGWTGVDFLPGSA